MEVAFFIQQYITGKGQLIFLYFRLDCEFEPVYCEFGPYRFLIHFIQTHACKKSNYMVGDRKRTLTI